ncbi:ATP-binding protein [Paenibacillus aurantius]|uniref:histidine kinase n=1 Tax=Paenibacillus aurantius TaxID=2918900 RepID=A0AA96LAZ9_9BACL|nr:ATP-binding protein [Paenibacillus aurantius]WNQ10326.1 ATP-binding protein [Paenibacillus aurantius]
MNVIKDFLLQLALSAIPMFTYQPFFEERGKQGWREKAVMAALWCLAVMLCMTFPAHFGEGYRLDVRVVPLVLGTLYGGPTTGLFLAVFTVGYRLAGGFDPGFYNTLGALLTAFPVVLGNVRRFQAADKAKRIRLGASLTLLYAFVGLLWFQVLNGGELGTLPVQGLHLLFVTVVGGLLTAFYEHLREIRRLRSEMLEAEKFRAIRDLTGIFAHEIRNPMQVVRGFLQLLDDPALPPRKKEFIQLSIEELDRANETINELLDFGKPAGGDNEEVEAGFQLQRVANLLHSYAELRSVTIHTERDADCWIRANPRKLSQCLVNILKNAVESMPEGGSIRAACSAEGDSRVLLTIEDQGVGMTREQLDRLGSPFYSLKESGTGLGMTVSFQIIRSLGGKVRVTSERGKGTRFAISFPKSDR